MFLALPPARADTADSEQVQLQLEVRVNGYPLDLIAAFIQMPDGKIGSPRSELIELGIAVPEGAPEDVIVLDTLAGVSYVYDEEQQAIEIELPNSSRIAKSLDAPKEDAAAALEPASGNGVVVNYTAYSSANYNLPNSALATNGGSLTLDARAFSSFGAVQQTAILGTTTFADATALRLDTTWSYSNPRHMLTYRLGDVVSGSLNWTRAIRLGGGQIQRNFGLRPDLVTMPLPEIQGTAEVPSTLNVFVGDVQAYSSEVQPGPFRIDNLPIYTTAGTARVVLTDSTGREVEQEKEFYTSPDLLKRDLYDFSVDAGVVRRDYGSDSFGYDDMPVGLGSLRYGLTNYLTGEAHVEASADLINGGIGALFSAGPYGMIDTAVAGSWTGDGMGMLVHAGWDFQYGDFGVQLSTTRTFGDFQDLVAVTTKSRDGDKHAGGVPRELDQVSFNYAFRDLKAGVGVSFINKLDAGGERSLIVSGSYSQTFKKDITAFVSGFADLGDERSYGAFGGLSIPLGASMTSTTGGSFDQNGWTAGAEVSQPGSGLPGSYSWRVGHGEGNQRTTSAAGTYRGTKARIEAQATQRDDELSANATISGAVVAAGGGIFLGNQIDDAFAVVDAGAPGVSVLYENRFAGKTDAGGKLLLPDLRSFQKNKVSIDVEDLPIAAAVPESETYVVPRDKSGVVVNFGIKTESLGALVALTDADGTFLEPGSEVTVEGSEEPFVVGYDGEVYITGLSKQNSLTVRYGSKECRVSFDYAPGDEAQTTIGPLQCL